MRVSQRVGQIVATTAFLLVALRAAARAQNQNPMSTGATVISGSGVCDDSGDDKYVAAAIEGRAAYVITGDRTFLALKEHAGVEIVTPRAFLDLLGS